MGFFPRFHEDKGREISVNISRITDLPTPYPLPRGDFLTCQIYETFDAYFLFYETYLFYIVFR